MRGLGWLVLLLAAPLSGLPVGKHLRQYGHQTWQNDSGLPQNTVNAVIQSHDGFLWMATEGGLVRFDGTDFLVFNTENTAAFRSNSIHGLMEDASGNLWVSTAAGLLSQRMGKFLRYGTEQGLPSDSVMNAYAMRDGGVVAITAGGVAVLRGHKFQVIEGTNNFSLIEGGVQFEQQGKLWVACGQQVFEIDLTTGRLIKSFSVTDIGELQAVAVTGPGDLWLGGSRGAESVIAGKSIRITDREGLPSGDVTALQAGKDGGMWIGTSAGLALFSSGHVQSVGKRDGIAGAAIRKLFVDREGMLWVGTAKGVARVNGRGEVMTLERPWLAGVLSMMEDREGNMWFGTDTAGVSILRDQAFFTVTTQDGLSADYVRTVFQDHAGNIWLGTNGGGLDEFPSGAGIAVHEKSKLSSDIVLSLAETRDSLWVGTPRGLNQIHGGQVRVFGAADGLADDFVRSLYADKDGSLWIGTRHGLSHYVSGKFISYSTTDGLGGDLIGTILRSRSGTLWVATLGGLSRLADERFVNSAIGTGGDKGGAAGEAVTSLLEDGQGLLWIGTLGGGLYRMRDGVLSNAATQETGLPDTIYGMLEDDKGDLWISSHNGIYRVGVAELNDYADKKARTMRFVHYGVADGMRTSEASDGGHPAAWRMADGTLWFATLSGAAVVNPSSTLRNEVPPKTVIEQVLVDDLPVEFDSQSAEPMVTVPPGNHQVAIRYAGLSFVAPQQVQYRYVMQGFDRAPIQAKGRRTAYYTNLPPGGYNFSVLSANNDGVWGVAAAQLKLTVKPYFTQTRWFYALIVVCLLALAYGVYRWRVLYVESKYSAVLMERGRIAREIHDTLAQGYVAVSVQLELASRLMKTSSEAALEPLERGKELVREGLAEARSSIWNLRSQAEAETLPVLLAGITGRRNRASTSEAISQRDPMMKLEIKGTYRPLPPDVEANLLRIAREAVANSRRHANAENIWIALSYDREMLRMRIVDDGIGIEDAAGDLVAQGHFGLQGMRERAHAIGARLNIQGREIEGTASQGTVVEVEMDLRRMNRKNSE